MTTDETAAGPSKPREGGVWNGGGVPGTTIDIFYLYITLCGYYRGPSRPRRWSGRDRGKTLEHMADRRRGGGGGQSFDQREASRTRTLCCVRGGTQVLTSGGAGLMSKLPAGPVYLPL